MEEFVSILTFFKDIIVMLFNVEVPLSSTLSIRWGSIVIGILALYLFIRLVFRLFSDAGAHNESKKE